MRSVPRLAAAVAAAAVLVSPALMAGALLQPIPAQEWKIEGWLNGDPGKLSDLRGKVVLIEFFQLWCPGCNNFSIPLFHRWSELYGDRDDVVLVSIHSVFEGHEYQTVKRLREFIRDKNIEHSVGIDSYPGPKATVPVTMQRYEAEGSPQVAIVDKFGNLRWSHFGRFDHRPVEGFIDRLLEEKEEDGGGAVRPPGDKAKDTKRSSGSSRSSSTRRERTPQPPAREEARRGSRRNDDSDEPDRSGKYRVILQQTSNSCGDSLPPQTVFADLEVVEDRIEVNFSRRLLGQQAVTLSYNAVSGGFDVDADVVAEESGAEVRLTVSASGRFIDGAKPPEIEFEFRLDKAGAEDGSNCTIEGVGSGGKAGA